MSTDPVSRPAAQEKEIDDAKDDLRRAVRRRRRHNHPHPATGHNAACRALTEHALEAVAGARSVAAYVSVGDEPCTRLLLDELEARGVAVLLPVLCPQLSRSWGYFRGAEDLAERAPGRPPEPSGPTMDQGAVAAVDALIVPALSVDGAGRRIGQGGGWYDRMLPLRREGAVVFAAIHPEELVPGPLPTEAHDEPVDAVISSQAWFLLRGSPAASPTRP